MPKPAGQSVAAATVSAVAMGMLRAGEVRGESESERRGKGV